MHRTVKDSLNFEHFYIVLPVIPNNNNNNDRAVQESQAGSAKPIMLPSCHHPATLKKVYSVSCLKPELI